jgi:hypothetical protein
MFKIKVHGCLGLGSYDPNSSSHLFLLEPTQELDYGINLLLNSNTKSKL